jgi:hypothetical protein
MERKEEAWKVTGGDEEFTLVDIIALQETM